MNCQSKLAKPKKDWTFFTLVGTIEFDGVHGEFTRLDDHTLIFDFRGDEVAFF